MVKDYPPLDYRKDVTVIALHESFPVHSEEIGTVHIGESGFTTNCTYNTVLNKAIEEARKAGGNAIKITKHVMPNLWSTCHRISAKILIVEEQAINEDNAPEDLSVAYFAEEEEDAPEFPYALLHIYRFKGPGTLLDYDLYLNNTFLCRVKNNWKETVKITEQGSFILWAKTEAKEEFPIKIEAGNEYFIRCAVGSGIFMGRPEIRLIDSRMGKYEFEAIK